MKLQKVCVYCASSRQTEPLFFSAAQALGKILALDKITVIYGGGAVGSMGHLADASLAAGGKVIGVIPRFMYDLEWAHQGLTELHVVENLHSRKRQMIDGTDAVIALPGGSGTLEVSLRRQSRVRSVMYVLASFRPSTHPLIRPRWTLFHGMKGAPAQDSCRSIS